MTTMATTRAWRARLDEWAVALTPTRRRALRDGLIVAGVLFNLTLLVLWGPRLYWFIDAVAWWHINLANLYGGMFDPGLIGAFRYAPAIAWLFVPLSWLSWPALIAVYLALSGLALTAMTGRRALLFLVAFPPVLLELVNGNIHLFIALAVWAGMRWPAAWAFVLLTKVTPGVGVLWFAGRRDWRGLAIALGTTVAIFAIGSVIAPNQWRDWLESLLVACLAAAVGLLLAYAWVFWLNAPGLRGALVGWSVLYPQTKLTPMVDFAQLLGIAAATVGPFVGLSVVPAWRDSSLLKFKAAVCAGYTRAAKVGESVLGTWNVVRVGAESAVVRSLTGQQVVMALNGCGARSG